MTVVFKGSHFQYFKPKDNTTTLGKDFALFMFLSIIDPEDIDFYEKLINADNMTAKQMIASRLDRNS